MRPIRKKKCKIREFDEICLPKFVEPISAYFQTVLIKERHFELFEEDNLFYETSLIQSNTHAWHGEYEYRRGKHQRHNFDQYSIPKPIDLSSLHSMDSCHHKILKEDNNL